MKNTLFNNFAEWNNLMVRKSIEKFIDKYQNKLNWDYISKYEKLNEQFIIKYLKKLNVKSLIENQELSTTFKIKLIEYV